MEEARSTVLDKSSLYNYKSRMDALVKEYHIAIERQLIAHDRLAECNRSEGVNQFVNCRDLALKYLELSEDKYHGMKFPPGVEVNRNRIPGLIKHSEE